MKAGLVGIGFMGWIHWLAYQRLENISVSAICSRDEKKRRGDWTGIKGNFGPEGEQVDLSQVNVLASIDQLLETDIDVVDICLPPHLHVEPCLKAIEAGKHVFCEKPLALDAADCDRLVQAARKKGVLLFVGQVLPYFPEYAKAREIIASGRYGNLIGGHFKRIISDPTWLDDFFEADRVGGPMIDLHVHDAHLIRMLFGMPRSVSSTGRMRGGVVEFCHSVFDYGDRNYAVASSCGVINQQGRPFTHGFEIHLEQATLTFELAVFCDGVESLSLKILLPDGSIEKPDLAGGDDITGFEGEITEVVECIQSGRESEILGGELARDAILLAEKQSQSVKTGKVVQLEV
ncbi:MAG: Gfo/Idh/MocA family oxidoreductase [Planctomycetota bacterium]|nr:Gfo/Idh/MocA family oxidoreductase [Planctomycetota bacterium]